MDFEWDDAKASFNLAQHGVDFEDALLVFLDHHRLELEDTREEYGESRYKTVGMVNGVTLVVIYTERQDAIRLISARIAEPRERRAYHEGQG